jgi:ATP adenylyltransferase
MEEIHHLWATWRGDYVQSAASERDALAEAGVAGTLFERILAADGADRDKHIVWRGERSWVLLNKFPYTSGHALVLPYVPVADLEDLDEETHTELWQTVRICVVAQKLAMRCHAVNVGLNLGAAAGGSQADHLHVHCVPRWQGDTNFMSATGSTRVHSVSLDAAWASLRASWDEATRRCQDAPDGA